MTERAGDFFAFVRERYRIFLRRGEGQPWPWTEDPILRKYHFCNVFREDDKTTRWIRERITEELSGPALLGALLIARRINSIPSLEKLTANTDLLHSWPGSLPLWAQEVRGLLKDQSPLTGRAYRVPTPNNRGLNKLEGLLWCFERDLPRTLKMQIELPRLNTLRRTAKRLQDLNHIGKFVAYEIATDLRHSLLREAPDIMTWACVGPGAVRGIGQCYHGDADYYQVGTSRRPKPNPKYEATYLTMVRELLQMSQDPTHWPQEWPAWEMREVEHTLCEFDKYERARSSGGAVRRYSGRGGLEL